MLLSNEKYEKTFLVGLEGSAEPIVVQEQYILFSSEIIILEVPYEK